MTNVAVTADVGGDGASAAEPSAAMPSQRWGWVGGLRSGKILAGLAILGFFVLVAIFGPIIDHTNPSALSPQSLEPPSAAHWLGTTQAGQDVFAQLLYGARVSLLVGFAAAAIATFVSLLVGLAAGYLGGTTDEVLSALSNIFLVIPALPLVIVLAGYLPNKGTLSVTLVIAVTGWAWGARVLRAQTLSIRKRDYIEAARASGERSLRVIFAEILPNELAIVASGFLFTVIFAILTEAGLAFLGLSSVTTWSWGTMLYWAENNEALQVGAWWWFLPPGLCIALVGTGLALINFGIDEFVNPRLRTTRIATKAAGKDLRAKPAPDKGGAERTGLPAPVLPGRGEPAGLTQEGPARPSTPLPTFTPVVTPRPSPGDRPKGGEDGGPQGDGRPQVGSALTRDRGARTGTTPGAEPSWDGGDVILDVTDLAVDYGSGDRALHAVDGVDLVLNRGEVLGIAGESGSGKSTLAYAMNRLLRPPGIVTRGRVRYHRPGGGRPIDIMALSDEELRRLRWDEVAMVFQSSMNALNPVLSLRAQIDDVLVAHRPEMGRAERYDRARELLRLVGISADRAASYPHELSGGMRQRSMIAMALALSPELIIMDEPTTALDVVIQRQILAEILRLRDRLGFSVIFITHDLSLLIEMADTIAVMYAGRVVEMCPSKDLYRAPFHPYSHGLLNSFPLLHGPKRELRGIPGAPPDLRAVPSGCAYHPRCPQAFEQCTEHVPRLLTDPLSTGATDRRVACLLYGPDRVARLAGQPSSLSPQASVHTPGGDGTGGDGGTAGRGDDGAAGRGDEVVLNGGPGYEVDEKPVLEAVNLVKHFRTGGGFSRQSRRRRVVQAVDGVSIALYAGQVTALVGESGSGKSTVARVLAGLYPATRGSIRLGGRRVRPGRGSSFKKYAKQVQLILQDPFGSLNPVHTVRYILTRPLRIYRGPRGRDDDALSALLADVNLSPPRQFLEKFPHELSGGQAQRISLARALAARPSVLLADEPVSMLDVSIRLGVLNLFRRLVEGRDLALLYITHDIASARYFATTTLVMYGGQLVEGGPSEVVTQTPAHPYTQVLVACAPDPERLEQGAPVTSTGEPPSLVAPPSGCRFHPRCPHAMDICRKSFPPRSVLEGGHWAHCWLYSSASSADGASADGEVATEAHQGTSGPS
ncbi:MAG TPA: dipeptide ABC transporter ATP-binding protein [Acidimicrobiales bacterium]|nr:dipeptide ABC transporter ATP-binding protein [Acidimicrobiales bacterium]